MTARQIPATMPAAGRPGPWGEIARRLLRDRLAVTCAAVVACFALLEVAVAAGLVARDWQSEVGVPYAPPVFLGSAPGSGVTAAADAPAPPPAGERADIRDVDPLAARQAEWQTARPGGTDSIPVARRRLAALPFGADRWGHDIVAKTLQGGKVSIFVGVVGALVATALGTLLGALAGYFGGRVDDALEWLYNVFEAIPALLLIFALAAVLSRGVATVVVILGLSGWTGLYRIVRAEYLRQRVRPYVLAAQAIGVGHGGRIVHHILPNVAHVILVRLSLLVIAFIKAEVILSFLGFGVAPDQVSWGTMIAESQNEILAGRWWQLVAAGVPMAVFVCAFAMLTDALSEALDPRQQR
jgi:peptide/nickel transport system permease protein